MAAARGCAPFFPVRSSTLASGIFSLKAIVKLGKLWRSDFDRTDPPQRMNQATQNWQLWSRGPVVKTVELAKPLLASWNANADPAQVRLRAYLDSVVESLTPLSEGPLFLHLEIDMIDPRRLLRYNDLENYLTPLFSSRCLPSSRFVLVSAVKAVGMGSRIRYGVAKTGTPLCNENWSHVTLCTGRNTSLPQWKEGIRQSLAANVESPLPTGPVNVRLAWRCGSHRNWSGLWKSTGDAMGPILGAPNPNRPYHVNDDRIVSLEFHRNLDDRLKHDVVLGVWWKPA